MEDAVGCGGIYQGRLSGHDAGLNISPRMNMIRQARF